MLSRDENQTLTQTDRDTPMGDVMRRYWMPALLSEELPGADCPPVRVKLLGEKLVAFRDTAGRIGLLDEFCPHRLASLFLGRNEEDGLRCVFHGWKFDVKGRCLDMMNEPPDSDFKDKMSIKSYPTVESCGLTWALMGVCHRRQTSNGPGFRPPTVTCLRTGRSATGFKVWKEGSTPPTRRSSTGPSRRTRTGPASA